MVWSDEVSGLLCSSSVVWRDEVSGLLCSSSVVWSDEIRQQTEEFVDMETPGPDGIRGADGSAPSMTSSRAGELLQVELTGPLLQVEFTGVGLQVEFTGRVYRCGVEFTGVV